MSEPPRIARIDELPAISTAGITWRPVRRELGVRAFGVNAYTADAGEQLIEEHDETTAGAGGHEELYVVIAGHARFTLDGAEHDAPAGTLVFVPGRATRRAAVALADATTALVIGGRAGEPYSVSPWESGFAAKQLADDGDPAAAADMMQAAIAEFPGNPVVLYNAACFEALAGRRDAALEHLSAAIDGDPRTREWAATDRDFDAIRDDPEFPVYSPG